MHLLHALAVFGLVATPALSKPLSVVTDIAPVAALVAEVQRGRGEVAAVVAPGTDAHHVSLRPSQARAVVSADIAIWIGPSLSPWFGLALERLAPDTASLPLLDKAPVRFERRTEDEHEAEGHSDAHDSDADPHAWLSPRNAAAWLDVIAETLAAADPEYAETYRANAGAGSSAILAAANVIGAHFAEGPGFAYVAAHDSFQYTEALTSGTFAGAVADSHATAPGPAHLAALETRIANGDVTCVVAAEGETSKLVARLAQDADLPVIQADALNAEIAPGGFVDWMTAFYDQLAGCRPES